MNKKKYTWDLDMSYAKDRKAIVQLVDFANRGGYEFRIINKNNNSVIPWTEWYSTKESDTLHHLTVSGKSRHWCLLVPGQCGTIAFFGDKITFKIYK